MEIKDEFYALCSWNVGNGEKTRFWEDILLGTKSFANQYPRLYGLTFSKEISVAKVFRDGRKSEVQENAVGGYFESLAGNSREMFGGNLNVEPDKIIWMPDVKGNFSVKSFYLQLKAHKKIHT